MSEIRSISTGSYTIGQTSGINFEAGTGIKITEPSEGTVRIGNDETVLWSGNIGVNSSATLSEPYTNFERIRIAGICGASEACNEGYTDLILGSTIHELSLRTVTMNSTAETDGSYNIIEFMPCLFSGNQVTTKNGRYLGYWGAKWQYQLNNNFSLRKVIGINRIAGGSNE